MPIHERQTIAVVFIQDRRIYEFDASVLDVISDPVPLIAIRTSGTLRSVQRRDDIRIRALVSVELAPRVVKLAGFRDASTRLRRIRCDTVNISAGGFSIHYSSAIAIGTVFEVKLALPAKICQPMQLGACVVHCAPTEGLADAAAAFDVGFVFTRISEAARQHMVRFIFGIQREEHLKE